MARSAVGRCGWRAPLRARRARAQRATVDRGVAGRDGGRMAASPRPDAAPARDAVGAAGARGAESVAGERRRRRFARVLARCSAPIRGGGARRCRRGRSTRCMRSRRARSSRRAAARCAPARCHAHRRRASAVRTAWTCAASGLHAPRSSAAVPWFALAALFAGDTAPPASTAIAAAPIGWTSSPIVTVNLWFDRPVLDEPFVGLPGRAMQWVFDKRQRSAKTASHLSLVSSGADAAGRADRTTSSIAAGRSEARRGAARARDAALVRGTVVREQRATFSLAPGQPARPATGTAVPGSVLAGDWIDTGLPGYDRKRGRQRPSRRRRHRGRCAVMKSIVVHYQEIALKGNNRPVVHRAARAQPAGGDWRISTCARSASLMGRIEIGARTGRGRGTQCASASARVFGIAQFLARPDARRSTSTRSPPRSSPISATRDAAIVPRVRAARRQAVPADLAADRARGRRPHQGGARLARRPRRIRS